MLGYFVADGKLSTDFNMYITDGGIYETAERDVEAVSVAGRNGDLTRDNGRYKNVKISYPSIITENFNHNFSELVNFLSTRKGYFRLEDSFNPETFYLARYTGGLKPKKVLNNGTLGKFTLEFDRKPQKFFIEGEYPITITASTSLLSVYDQIAKPLVRVYGKGTFSIGTSTIEVTKNDSYIDIDCDMQEAFKDSLSDNQNDNIVLTSGNFPELIQGENNVVLGKGITKLEIKPRWWKI